MTKSITRDIDGIRYAVQTTRNGQDWAVSVYHGRRSVTERFRLQPGEMAPDSASGDRASFVTDKLIGILHDRRKKGA